MRRGANASSGTMGLAQMQPRLRVRFMGGMSTPARHEQGDYLGAVVDAEEEQTECEQQYESKDPPARSAIAHLPWCQAGRERKRVKDCRCKC